MGSMTPAGLVARPIVENDLAALEDCLRGIAQFQPREVEVAFEVFEAAALGDIEYRTLALFEGDRPRAAICFGPAPLSAGTYVVYWLLTDAKWQGRGLGKWLARAAEEQARAERARMMVIETAGKPSYRATRGFWEACGYREEARVEDFYAVGDPVIFYVKRFPQTVPQP